MSQHRICPDNGLYQLGAFWAPEFVPLRIKQQPFGIFPCEKLPANEAMHGAHLGLTADLLTTGSQHCLLSI